MKTKQIQVYGASPSHSYTYFGSFAGTLELRENEMVLVRRGTYDAKGRKYKDMVYKKSLDSISEIHKTICQTGTNSRHGNQVLKEILEFYGIPEKTFNAFQQLRQWGKIYVGKNGI